MEPPALAVPFSRSIRLPLQSTYQTIYWSHVPPTPIWRSAAHKYSSPYQQIRSSSVCIASALTSAKTGQVSRSFANVWTILWRNGWEHVLWNSSTCGHCVHDSGTGRDSMVIGAKGHSSGEKASRSSPRSRQSTSESNADVVQVPARSTGVRSRHGIDLEPPCTAGTSDRDAVSEIGSSSVTRSPSTSTRTLGRNSSPS